MKYSYYIFIIFFMYFWIMFFNILINYSYYILLYFLCISGAMEIDVCFSKIFKNIYCFIKQGNMVHARPRRVGTM